MSARKSVMPDALRVLILDVDVPCDLAAATAELRHRYPGAEATVITRDSERTGVRTIHSGGSFTDTWRTLKSLRHEQFNYYAIPYRPRFLIKPLYLLRLLLILVCGRGKTAFLLLSGEAGRLRSPLKAIIFNPFWLWLWAPLVSVGIIIIRPYYVLTQVIWQFVLARQDSNDEFVGFGKGKTQGGLVYWLMTSKKAKRYGLFGFADNTYLGVPVSVHSFPLTLFVLGRLGYRNLIYVSAGLISAGLAWLCIAQGHFKMLALVPAVIFSTYFWQHVYYGTWEPLAWGFSILALASLVAGSPVWAGVFLAATIVSHVGAALLTSALLVSWSLLAQYSVTNLAWIAAVSLLLSLFYIVPFVRARNKFGRNIQINSLWKGKYSLVWLPERMYQGLIYALFLVAFLRGGNYSLSLIVYVLPLLALIFNESIYWVFSPYTLQTFMLVTGAFALCLHPSVAPLCVYLILIYTSPRAISPEDGELWGDDLTPVTLGDRRDKVLALFKGLQGRVAFEHPPQNFALWFTRAGLSYVLADEDIDLLNTGYTEVGDAAISKKYVHFFNANASREEFESACQEAAVKYMVTFTNTFENQMRSWGYKQIGGLEKIGFSPARAGATVDLKLFELPWRITRIAPETELSLFRNKMQFRGEAGLSYTLRFSYYPGWQAFQDGKRIPIKDARPGMTICPPLTGLVTLRYSYWHYWF